MPVLINEFERRSVKHLVEFVLCGDLSVREIVKA